jgi:hypothetical protein
MFRVFDAAGAASVASGKTGWNRVLRGEIA